MQRLKSALWFSIGKIVDEETLKLGVNATPQFIGALTEMVWAQIGRPVLSLTATTRAHADMISSMTENVSTELKNFAKSAISL